MKSGVAERAIFSVSPTLLSSRCGLYEYEYEYEYESESEYDEDDAEEK